jgi:hypothetical protein
MIWFNAVEDTRYNGVRHPSRFTFCEPPHGMATCPVFGVLPILVHCNTVTVAAKHMMQWDARYQCLIAAVRFDL